MTKTNIMERLVKHVLTISDEEIGSLNLRSAAGSSRIFFLILGFLFILIRGETFHCFVERQKLIRAARHLEIKKDIDIFELSKRLGFAGTDDFSEKFKKYFLIKPERYWELAQVKEYNWENRQ